MNEMTAGKGTQEMSTSEQITAMVGSMNQLINVVYGFEKRMSAVETWMGESEKKDTELREEIRRTKDEVKAVSEKVDDGILLTRTEKRKINSIIHTRVRTLLHLSPNRKNWTDSEMERYLKYYRGFCQIAHSELNKKYDVSSFEDIPKVKFTLACEFCEDWVPDCGTKELIKFYDKKAAVTARLKSAAG